MTRHSRNYLLLALLLLVLSLMACNGRITSRQNTLPTQVPEAVVPTETNPLQIPATFTPPAQPAVIEVEPGTAVDPTPLSTIATDTAVPLPTQEPALSAETENLFNDLDNLLNQIDELDSDDLSDLP
jgi:hypothetical protein